MDPYHRAPSLAPSLTDALPLPGAPPRRDNARPTKWRNFLPQLRPSLSLSPSLFLFFTLSLCHSLSLSPTLFLSFTLSLSLSLSPSSCWLCPPPPPYIIRLFFIPLAGSSSPWWAVGGELQNVQNAEGRGPRAKLGPGAGHIPWPGPYAPEWAACRGHLSVDLLCPCVFFQTLRF